MFFFDFTKFWFKQKVCNDTTYSECNNLSLEYADWLTDTMGDTLNQLIDESRQSAKNVSVFFSE